MVRKLKILGIQDVDGAVKRGLGALEFRHEILEWDRGAAIREDGVKVEDAVEFVHYSSSGPAVRAPALAGHRRVRGVTLTRLTDSVRCHILVAIFAQQPHRREKWDPPTHAKAAEEMSVANRRLVAPVGNISPEP